jgi:hypothetical protein
MQRQSPRRRLANSESRSSSAGRVIHSMSVRVDTRITEEACVERVHGCPVVRSAAGGVRWAYRANPRDARVNEERVHVDVRDLHGHDALPDALGASHRQDDPNR